jgi:hypothetical protein
MNRQESNANEDPRGEMTMTTRRTQAAATTIFHATDGELLDRLDHLVGLATIGDRDAVGAIAIAFGPTLLAEARAAIGPDGERHPWMKRMVRLLAEKQRRDAWPGGDLAG